MKHVMSSLLLMIGLSAGAQQFTASVSKNSVSTGETFQITFSLENADGKNFKAPDFDYFQVISGPNQSTSMQYINGSMSRSISYSYHLRPTREGSLSIGPASIEAGGKTLYTNSVNMEVVKGQVQNQGSSQQNRQQDIHSQVVDNVFLRLIVDKTEAYQGEQINASYKLYSRMNISNTSVSKAPSYTGFWSQEIKLPDNVQFQSEIYNGVQYNAAVIKKDALFPQRSGELTIDPMELETNVRLQVQGQRRSFFDDFFGSYQNYPHKFSSNSVKIKVKPLPAANKPASFKGGVGDYTMDVTLDKTQTQTDEPVALTIKLSGTGNIKMLDLPTIDLPQDFEVFDPKASERISKSNNINGYKSYEYLIIPRRPGQFKLPVVEFSYFSLKKKDYVILRSKEFIIHVEGEISSVSPAISGISKEEVELLGEDIRYIKGGNGNLKTKDEFLLGSWKYAGIYGSPVLLFLFLLAYKKREDKISGNSSLVKQRRAAKEAAKRLKKAKKFLATQDRKAFYDEISKAVWGFLGDKLNIDPAQLSRDKVEVALKDKNIRAESIQKTFKILDDSEMALFAPESDGEMQQSYQEASDLIVKLGGELK